MYQRAGFRQTAQSPLLQDFSLQPNTSGTSVFWEQWVCAPMLGKEKEYGYFPNDERNSCPEINDLLYFKWQTHFFARTLALGKPLVTLLSNNIGSLFRRASGKTKCWLNLDSGEWKQMHASQELNRLLPFDVKCVFMEHWTGGLGLKYKMRWKVEVGFFSLMRKWHIKVNLFVSSSTTLVKAVAADIIVKILRNVSTFFKRMQIRNKFSALSVKVLGKILLSCY